LITTSAASAHPGFFLMGLSFIIALYVVKAHTLINQVSRYVSQHLREV
jgi:hypothetical protein